MLLPQLDTTSFISDVISNPLFALGARRGAHLMIGWTVLLFWADRKPVERKDILLITLCPVEAGRLVYLIYARMADFTSLEQVVPNLIIEIIFIVFFFIGYLNAKHIEATFKPREA